MKGAAILFHLEYEKELDYAQWGKHLLILTWQFVLIIFGAELAIFVAYWALDMLDYGVATYLLLYLVRPTLGSVAIVGFTTWLSNRLLRQGKFALQAYSYITGIVGLCFLLCWVHDYVLVTQVVFAIPMLLALTYVDIKPIRYAAILSVGGYLLFVALLHLRARYVHKYLPDIAVVLTTVAIICVMSWITTMVLRHQSELITHIRGAQHQSKLDSLTKLYNHATFYEQLDEHIQGHLADGHPFHLLVLDIDNFKVVNDVHGHGTGDAVIMALVDAVRRHTDERDTAFRYGGEEFALLTTRQQADSLALAEAVRGCFCQNTRQLPNPLEVTVSVGICQYDRQRFGGRREFFAAADEALYHAKRTGKNQAVLWAPQLHLRGLLD